MSNQRYSPEFKDEAVRQVVDRGYSVPEVAERLGVSSHSLYKWVKAIKPDQSEQQATWTFARGSLRRSIYGVKYRLTAEEPQVIL